MKPSPRDRRPTATPRASRLLGARTALVLGAGLTCFTVAACGGGGSSGSGGSTSGTSTGGGGSSGKDQHLVLLYTSDEHSHLFSFAPELDDFPSDPQAGTGKLVGGVARRATLIKKEREAAKTAGRDSLLVSAGDNQMGCLPHVAFETDSIDYGTMKDLGYDVTTLGNHEFDFGPGALAKSIDAAKAGSGLPPIVATNIKFSKTSGDDDALEKHYSADAKTDAPIHPYRVITTESGLKVGFIGIVGVNASAVAPNKAPVSFSEEGVAAKDAAKPEVVLPKVYADLQPVVDTLRDTEKVDLVVALSHSGISNIDQPAEGEDGKIAANVAGIDVIISGHEHKLDAKPMLVKNTKTGHDVIILNGGAYGKLLGRIELTIPGDKTKATTFDDSTQAMIAVDDKTAPDAERAAKLDSLVSLVEKSGAGASGSYLEGLLTRVDGMPVKDDTAKAGDLYFHPVGKTSFDLIDTSSLLYLSADAMITVANKIGKKADIALDSTGVIRSPIMKGKTGVISAADAFNVVPLGRSPMDGTLGYPIVQVFISGLELRGVLEFTLALRATQDDFNLGWAGIKVEYDATRPPVAKSTDLFNKDKGQVMRISLDTDHSDGFEQFDKVIYDREAGTDNVAALYAIIGSSYVATFASTAGVSLKNEQGMPLKLTDGIIHHGDTTEVKQLESFLGFLKNAPGGTLPDLYDAKSANAAKRLVCLKGC
ncbi:MAG: 5'-nucleotidase C-terminal domain-containing protein [Minicystis sp.]